MISLPESCLDLSIEDERQMVFQSSGIDYTCEREEETDEELLVDETYEEMSVDETSEELSVYETDEELSVDERDIVEETDEETYEELSVDERDIVEETIVVPIHYANEYKNVKYEVYKNENISNIINDEFLSKINNHDFISISDDSFFSNTIDDEFLYDDNYLVNIEQVYHILV
jgi:hypothetical protein